MSSSHTDTSLAAVPDQFDPASGGNRWGFPPPRSWFEEASEFAGVPLRRPPVEGDPLTLEKYLSSKSWRRAPDRLRKSA